MSNTDDLNRAAQALLEADIRLRTVKAQVDGLDREIAMLTSMELELEDNIRFLKRSKSVTIASEYKKSLDQLEKTRQRKSFLRIDRSNVMKAVNYAEMLLAKAQEAHTAAMDVINNPPKNVIHVDFGKKDGQE